MAILRGRRILETLLLFGKLNDPEPARNSMGRKENTDPLQDPIRLCKAMKENGALSQSARGISINIREEERGGGGTPGVVS